MKYRPPRTWTRGRWSAQFAAHALNLPRLHFYADGQTDLLIGATYGNGSSDPVLSIDLTLSGTRAARILVALYWWVREHLART